MAHVAAGVGSSDLRTLHPGYYWPSEEDFRDLWSNALIALDASVLLSLYRYSTDTAEELLGILESVSGRVWIPAQAAIEFERNRITVIRQQQAAYDEVLDALDKSTEAFRRIAKSLRRHPALEADPLERLVERFEDDVIEYVDKTRDHHPHGVGSAHALIEDPLRERLGMIAAGRVGTEMTSDDLERLFEEGRRRFADGVPPGFADLDKGEPGCFGDLVFWQEAVARAISEERPLIVVTDDAKDDWWWRESGLTLGPRPELVQEFWDRCGQTFFMYNSAGFMDRASEYLSRSVSEVAIREVEEVARERATRVEEVLACPSCRVEIPFQLGTEVGSSAVPNCPSCGISFHAHRNREGKAFTTQTITPLECARCKTLFRVSKPTSGDSETERPCFNCLAKLEIDWDGRTTSVIGEASVVEAIQVTSKAMTCPIDDSSVPIMHHTPAGLPEGVCRKCGALVRGAASP